MRYGELVSQGVPPRRGRGRAHADHQVKHAEPLPGPGELAPPEPVAHPDQRLAVTGGNWRHHECAATLAQVPGGGQRRAQTIEREGQRLVVLELPLVQLIGGNNHRDPAASVTSQWWLPQPTARY